MTIPCLRIDEKVLRLYVPMYDVGLVTEFDCLQKLVYVLAHGLGLKPTWPLLEYFEQVFLHVLKYQIETVLPA
jgi:hypothetical protein